MPKFLKKIARLFRSDGIIYGPGGMYVDLEKLEHDQMSQEIEAKIKEIWQQNVDYRGCSKPRPEVLASVG